MLWQHKGEWFLESPNSAGLSQKAVVFDPFQAVGNEGGLMGCVQSRGLGARAPGLSGFILLGSFGGTLLGVSILGMVYDCRLGLLLQSWGVY